MGKHGDGVLDELSQIEVDGLQLHVARLDLRKIQDVVDDPEQVLAGNARDQFGIVPLVSSRRVSRTTSVIPSTPFMGVRISWLIVARKRLLA